MESNHSTESDEGLYDRSSKDWQRAEPMLLSDFTVRPFLLDWCNPVQGCRVLDLGCGEGYVARQLKQRGAARLDGVDSSPEMIRTAQEQESSQKLGIRFRAGDATDLSVFADESFDLVVAVFLFNYLTAEQSVTTMREVARVLRPGGRFVFAVPHPSLPFIRPQEPPFYFAPDGHGYFTGRGHSFEGRLWRRDGKSVPVRCVHKTLEDYFTCLRSAGFLGLPELKELHVTNEHVALDSEFFEPVRDQPLHLAFRTHKAN